MPLAVTPAMVTDVPVVNPWSVLVLTEIVLEPSLATMLEMVFIVVIADSAFCGVDVTVEIVDFGCGLRAAAVMGLATLATVSELRSLGGTPTVPVRIVAETPLSFVTLSTLLLTLLTVYLNPSTVMVSPGRKPVSSATVNDELELVNDEPLRVELWRTHADLPLVMAFRNGWAPT